MEGHQLLTFYLGGIPNLSPIGARQFATAQPVTGYQDRRLLARALYQQLGFTVGPGTSIPMAMLIPAIQAAREAARRTSRAELTVAGAQEFLLGQPVSDAGDAALLAELLAAGASKVPGTHKITDVTLKRG